MRADDDGAATGATGATLAAETADGLRLTLTRAPADAAGDGAWVRVRAEALTPEAGATAADLASRLEGLVFALSAWNAAPLDWTLDQIAPPIQS